MPTAPDGDSGVEAQETVVGRLVLCAVEDVPQGQALEVEIDDFFLAVFNVAGSFYVTDNSCTHGPGLLAEGSLVGRVVECDFHGGRFDVVTGGVMAPPCLVPVRTYRTVVEHGKVSIEVK